MANNDIQLMAHLMRRAGFGAPYEELEARAAKGYEATVEELLRADENLDWEEDLARRHMIGGHLGNAMPEIQGYWMQRMISTTRPLREKMTLFWHTILCSGDSKIDHPETMDTHIDMVRENALGRYPDLLVALSRDPGMIIYLDNRYSHKDSINENYGRELLELFSMGVGNYTEDDIKMAARAFTGWTLAPAMSSALPYQRHAFKFQYDPEDHDDGEKVFLGQRGRFNGDDIINIIARQPATARFIARHLYDFFVADEVQVPAWQTTPPRDPAAVNVLADAYLQSNYDIRSVLRVLFNSGFFKDESVWYARVKSPVEVVVGTMRLVGDHLTPAPGIESLVGEAGGMGQILLNPPSVEGWHGGKEWINSGALVNRVNFVANRVGDLSLPGVQRIVARLGDNTEPISPSDFVDGCLELMGSMRVEEDTRHALIAHVERGGPLGRDTEEERTSFGSKVGELLQLIASSREYQFA
ncbi:MAG TPA: DUF1800 domain-containing protein [Dehalococcoidia bacterium]|jgi:uncharacterized protein (DUF1800 family)|nr:DUF1800 domain-containing protein [Dehalococcoidia bacterium]MEE2925929.1 DUF1800 domain-containing protein [Chloroflexota bacterium]HIM50276.1 DUF1800 domain-containing protein [Dehalococcoidia bacterium]|tara:strand:- start:1582 stop:2994 length:1413 start_codon:yes stop_codon:yes gene_type:complete